MKLIFVMENGAFKPQGSPCLKSSIFGPPCGETFQIAHPVMKPAKKSKKDSLKFAFTTYSQVLSFCIIFDFPTMKASVKRVMKIFLTSLLFVVPKANMLLFRSEF